MQSSVPSRSFAALVAALVLGAPTARAADTVTPAFAADVRRLMEASGASQLGLQVGHALAASMARGLRAGTPGISDRAVEIVVDVVGETLGESNQALLGRLVPLYAEHFTHDEVKQLLRFYEGPLGRKLVKELPALTAQSMTIGEEWAREAMPAVRDELERRFQAEGILEEVEASRPSNPPPAP